MSGYLSNVTYHPNGQLKSMTQGSYCSVTQSLKAYGVPDTQRTVCRGNTALYNQYHYDGNLNVTFWDDKQSNSYDLRFTYDGLDRLDVIKNGSYTTIGDMDYDAMGNITKFKFGSNQVNYSYDSTKKLASTWGAVSYSMSYDDRGNVLGNGQKSFTYNLANQMTQGHGNSYRYDGHDSRVKAVDSKGTRYSFYNVQGKLIFEQINGTNRENYYLGSQLVAYKNGTTVTHIHSDLMGSTAATSNSAGAVLTRSRYKPFGNEWGSAKNEMGYTGHKFDTDLGLSYMQARYYDPVIGRFYSNDPIGFTGEVDTFNRYSYVANNPYKYTDPTGMSKSFDERQKERALKHYNGCEKDPNCQNLIPRSIDNEGIPSEFTLSIGKINLAINTVVTDGNGGLKVQFGTNNTGEIDPIVKAGVMLHESQHIKYFLNFASNIGILKGQPANHTVLISRSALSVIERRATRRELNFLMKKQPTANAISAYFIKHRIIQLEAQYDGYK